MDGYQFTGALLAIFAIFLYLVPGFLAVKRGHQYAGLIFTLNLLFGWLFLTWIIFLFMAMSGDSKEDRELKKLQMEKLKREADRLDT